MAASTSSVKVFSSLVNLQNTKSSIIYSPAKKLVPFNISSSFLSQNLKICTTQSTRSFTCKSQAESCDSRPSKVQEFYVFELNERDRGSPVYLRLSNKTVNSLGDLIPFSNKLYTGDLQKRLGISAGIMALIKHDDEKNGDRYHAQYTMYFGDYGTIAVQGAYLTWGEDTYLAICGGTGIFEGVYGQVKLQQIVYPFKIFYTFYLRGIADLPAELAVKPADPVPTVEAAPAARALKPEGVVKNFTD